MKVLDTKHLIEELLTKCKYKLYSINYFKKDNIYEILLDESLSLDDIENVSNKISSLLDTLDIDEESYMLDVSCVGLEKQIKDLNTLQDEIGKYICINEVEYGTLLEVFQDKIFIEVKDKNRLKKKEIQIKDIKKCRYAIKF